MTNTTYPPHVNAVTIDRGAAPSRFDLWFEQPLITMHIEVNSPDLTSEAWELIRPEGAVLFAPPSVHSAGADDVRFVEHPVADIPHVVSTYLGLRQERDRSELDAMVVPLAALRQIPQDADHPAMVIDALEHAAVDERTAAGLTLLLAARRFSWRITTLSNRTGKAEEHSMAVLDAGPFGLWHLQRSPEALCLAPSTPNDTIAEFVRLLRAS
jgi:hypothetical protein